MIDPLVLLDRDPIDFGADGSGLAGRRVLVTGAGGSIGSVLCQHLARLNPAKLIMLDRDESGLHAAQLAISGRALLDDDSTVLADIRDREWIKSVFSAYGPDVVFHAAALKHQPLLERYPAEAVKTNIIGTRNVMLAASRANVSTFINVSTDKAANPSCVLGASKRVAERIVSWFGEHHDICAKSVRFGNVINSRGSVLDAFTAQLAAGVPLTVTGHEVNRYFMTGYEAADLLIAATAIGENRQALIPDMGHPVRIIDIAERLIAASGHGWIEYTRLRPGEKITEELIGFGERDRRPSHPLITQVDVPALSPIVIGRLARQIDSEDESIGATLMNIALRGK